MGETSIEWCDIQAWAADLAMAFLEQVRSQDGEAGTLVPVPYEYTRDILEGLLTETRVAAWQAGRRAGIVEAAHECEDESAQWASDSGLGTGIRQGVAAVCAKRVRALLERGDDR